MPLFRPVPLSSSVLPSDVLRRDAASAMRFGPAGVGEKAVYLGAFMRKRHGYVPYDAIRRVYKRIAMTKGGFSGRGMFASAAYLVVELRDGGERSCYIGREDIVDSLLSAVMAKAPGLLFMSEAAEERVRRRREEEASRMRDGLGKDAEALIEGLARERSFLEAEPSLYTALSVASRRKRSEDISKPMLRYVATAIVLLGVVVSAYGVFSLINDGLGDSLYIVIFGIAMVFLFSGLSVIPSGRDSRRMIQRRLDDAVNAMVEYIKGYPGFPLPPYYAHPMVLTRMIRVVREGRAADWQDAFSIMKDELRAIDGSCSVSQDEYDEIMAIKPMFLIHGWE